MSVITTTNKTIQCDHCHIKDTERTDHIWFTLRFNGRIVLDNKTFCSPLCGETWRDEHYTVVETSSAEILGL